MMNPNWLDEPHHKWYGRPWIMGRYQFEALIHDGGMLRRSRLLDVGCGSGRLAIHAAPFLGPGRYVGVEPDPAARDAMLTYELPLHGIDPVRVFADISEVRGRFTHAMDFWVTAHLPLEDVLKIDEALVSLLDGSGTLLRCPASLAENSPLRCLGTFEQTCAALVGSQYDPVNRWGIYGV